MAGESKMMCLGTAKQGTGIAMEARAGEATVPGRVTTTTYEPTVGGEALTIATASRQVSVENEATRGTVRKKGADSKPIVDEGNETDCPSPKRTRLQEPAEPTAEPTAAPRRDVWTVFGEGVTLRLKEIKDEKKRREARRRIENVLYELEDE